LAPDQKTTELAEVKILACVAGGIFGAQEVKFFGAGAAKSEWQNRDKYRLPENLGFLHAAHFYHFIDHN